jgi:hypothetical protein
LTIKAKIIAMTNCKPIRGKHPAKTPAAKPLAIF